MATKKKKAPAKKKKAPTKKKRRAPTISMVPVKDAEKPDATPKEKSRQRAHLRHYAQMLYTTSVNGVTVAEVAKHPILANIPDTTVIRWSVQDQWSEKRRITLEGWKTQIESKIGDALVQSRIQSIKRMQAIRDKLFDKLTPEHHPWVHGGYISVGNQPFEICGQCGNTLLQHIDPFAGVPGDRAVKALMDLVAMELQLQEMVLQVTQTPGYGQRHAAGNVRPQDALPSAKVELSMQEMRNAAMAVLKKRREDMRGSP